MKKTKKQVEAIEKLNEFLKDTKTIYTVLRHCSKSGMTRSISLKYIDSNGDFNSLDYWAAIAMGDKIDQKNGGIKIGGCGMDMGFALVYNLGRTISDNSNGDGGYRFNQQWI